MPINLILFLLANLMIGIIPSDFPELLINIKTSFLVMLPRSPCKQSLADREKVGFPTDDKVDAI